MSQEGPGTVRRMSPWTGGGLSKGSWPVFTWVSEKITDNSVWLGRQAKPGIGPQKILMTERDGIKRCRVFFVQRKHQHWGISFKKTLVKLSHLSVMQIRSVIFLSLAWNYMKIFFKYCLIVQQCKDFFHNTFYNYTS